MDGLYFYKLVSPYCEDVTKDCKLTINEIDHNFITLKEADIVDATFDKINNKIILKKKNGSVLECPISNLDGAVHNLKVEYDEKEGIITISNDGNVTTLGGLITEKNIDAKFVGLTAVTSDSSLVGLGTKGCPLGIKNVEKTGQIRPCISFLDSKKREVLPPPHAVKIGDRFLTRERSSYYGMLYDYKAVLMINRDLTCGWRVPSKSDWDNILNAIEPCDKNRNHGSLQCNIELGFIAGKLLKSTCGWHGQPKPRPGFKPNTDEYDDDVYDESLKENELACDKYENAYSPCKKGCHGGYHYGAEDVSEVEDSNYGCSTPVFGHDDMYPHPHHHHHHEHVNPYGVDAFGVQVLPCGYGDGLALMDYFGHRGGYWTTTMIDNTDVYIKRFDCDKAGVVQKAVSPKALFSIKLVKDYDGTNFNEFDVINGYYYRCVLVPCLNTEKGFIIVTMDNVAFMDEKYRPRCIDACHDFVYKHEYLSCEWNGLFWNKKLFNEGESVVLKHYCTYEPYEEFRLIGGNLICTKDKMYNQILDKINPKLCKLEKDLNDEIQRAVAEETRLQTEIEELNSKLETESERAKLEEERIESKLDKEIADRIDVDAQIWQALNNEIAARQEVEAQLWNSLNEEIRARQEVEAQIWESVNTLYTNLEQETNDRIAEDNRISAALEQETADRIAEDNRISAALEQETADRIAEDNRISAALEQETNDRVAEDNRISAALEQETADRIAEDNRISAALEQETSDRIMVDNQQWERINYNTEHLLVQDGTVYDCVNGVLTLMTENPDNKINVQFNGNYGTF